MNDKFSLDELVIRIMPGGAFLAFLYFYVGRNIELNIDSRMDVLITFLFFCVAFIVGELLQTLAHESEWLIDCFFKCRRPSRVFLYKNNPVVRNELRREEVLSILSLTDTQRQAFETEYSEISAFSRTKEKDQSDLSQKMFWKLYARVISEEGVKTVNRNYLFVRVMMMEFLLIAAILFISDELLAGGISLAITVIFLWRARGLARGLVFKTVLFALRDK